MLDDRKQVMRMFSYGLYVMTARDGDDVSAATVTWVSQASFEPLRITVAVRGDSSGHAILEKTSRFALHFLRKEQTDLAMTFFKPPVVEGNKLSGEQFHDGSFSGAPILDNAPGWLEAEVVNRVDGGDHTVFVAEVKALGMQGEEGEILSLRDTTWHYAH